MVRKTYDDDSKNHIHYIFERALQSANINLLVGSGASFPAIELAGNIEEEIDKLLRENKQSEADGKKCEFIKTVQTPTNNLLKNESNEANDKVVEYYRTLLNTLTEILIKRKTQLLPTQATIFTTNYDLFIEKAFETIQSARLNDGFNRIPSLNNRFEFSPQNFFETIFTSGNLYDYKVEIPAINLVKLHGSLSWKRDNEDIICSFDQTDELPDNPSEKDIEKYLEQFAVVLPQMGKFQETVMNRIYYDLLRIYSNQLDKKNSLLIVFGFSFADQHIREITQRALKNPTLKVIIFSYSTNDANNFHEIFGRYNNVDIIEPTKDAKIGFETFNSILASVISPKEVSKEDENVD